MRALRLTVIAPEGLWETLKSGLGRLYPDLQLVPLPSRSSLGKDPYGVGPLLLRLPRPDAAILVAPVSRSPARLVPAPVLNGVPVGIVHASTSEQLKPWLAAVSSSRDAKGNHTWASLAMWKSLYLIWGEHFAEWMQAGAEGTNIKVQKWFADEVSRDDLCQKLAEGPRLAVYLGHGRARGWSGYQGMRWEHVAACNLKRPCGTLVSISCSTLKWKIGEPSFGARWVSEGRACCYVGSVGSVSHKANAAMAEVLGTALASCHPQTVGELLATVSDRLHQSSTPLLAQQAWAAYRIMGTPLQPI